ncbi:heparan-alpha-glucosaminide N-acetyltransferase domain-containing protein [Brachybacterium tyrofermentans]|uniref:heparan-alpha-glucosaminide N-acetyltransferase domain-containing protein n=1 Tax=Brachybacterium tyrofermentans TaxID=47848 RepID=UPI003FD3E358
MDATSPEQGPRSRRIPAIDAARGLALLGMIVVNVGPVLYDSPLQWIWLIPRGRASVLFVLLAGLSMAFFLRNRRMSQTWPVLLWRVAILFGGGLLLSVLPHGVNVILPLYAALFLVAPVLFRLPTKVLVVSAVALGLIGPLLFVMETFQHGEGYRGELRWTGEPLQFLHSLVLSRPYPFVVWLVPFFMGLLFSRADLRDHRTQSRLIGFGGAAAVIGFVVAEIGGRLLGPDPQGFELLLTGAPHSQMPLWLISAIGSAVLVLGIVLRYWSVLGSTLSPATLLGRMPLTFYVAHLLVLAVVSPLWDYGFLGGVIITVVMSAVFVVATVLLDRSLGTGPFELLLRGRWIERATQRPQSQHESP